MRKFPCVTVHQHLLINAHVFIPCVKPSGWLPIALTVGVYLGLPSASLLLLPLCLSPFQWDWGSKGFLEGYTACCVVALVKLQVSVECYQRDLFPDPRQRQAALPFTFFSYSSPHSHTTNTLASSLICSPLYHSRALCTRHLYELCRAGRTQSVLCVAVDWTDSSLHANHSGRHQEQKPRMTQPCSGNQSSPFKPLITFLPWDIFCPVYLKKAHFH